MALQSCPECGWSVSDSAESCPNCGYPVGRNRRRSKRRGFVSRHPLLTLLLLYIVFRLVVSFATRGALVRGSVSEVLYQLNQMEPSGNARVEVTGYAYHEGSTPGNLVIYEQDVAEAGMDQDHIFCWLKGQNGTSYYGRVTVRGTVDLSKDASPDSAMLWNATVQ